MSEASRLVSAKVLGQSASISQGISHDPVLRSIATAVDLLIRTMCALAS